MEELKDLKSLETKNEDIQKFKKILKYSSSFNFHGLEARKLHAQIHCHINKYVAENKEIS